MERRPEGQGDKAGQGHRSQCLVGLRGDVELSFRSSGKSLKGFAQKRDIIRVSFLKIILMTL